MKNCTQLATASSNAPDVQFLSVTAKRKNAAQKLITLTWTMLSLALFSNQAQSQLGIYEFTGAGTCPHQNLAVTVPPANAVFTNISTVNANCNIATDVYKTNLWNKTASIDLTEYHQFSINANAGYLVTLSNLSFAHSVSENGTGNGTGNTMWHLRSSIDNYATDVATGLAEQNVQTPVITLPAASFSNIAGVTFRLYLKEIKDDITTWTIDNLTINGPVYLAPLDPPNPTSNSPQCSIPGVTLTATGTAPAGETWYWQNAATGTNTVNSGATYVVTTGGNYYLRSRDNTTLAWSFGAGSTTVVVTPDVTVPVFSSGTNSSRCYGSSTVTYNAAAANSTGITYSLDATSIAAGNTINTATGEVTYAAGWIGTSTITASADGCAGPTTSTHTALTRGDVQTPVFALGATSERCQATSSVTYSATATDATSITYSLDAISLASGNTINSTTGAVTYSGLWFGTSTITATAAGCNGPTTANHTVTIGGTVSSPVFAMSGSSSRCQAAGSVTYSATATNNTSLTYTLDATSLAAGNTINSATGEVTYLGSWSGVSSITATAAGCGGPRSTTHTATTNGIVATPVFALGATSTRCQSTNNVTYTATASNSTSLSYSLDAASLAGGNTINSATGFVDYSSTWAGSSTITVSAAGCSGPTSETHTVTTTPTVGLPVFVSGNSSIRCQGAGTVQYAANATNTTGITYSLNGTALSAGNTINPTTGDVNYVAGWTGSTVITASAAGCGGPRTSTHTVTITPTVGAPTFVLGSSTVRCQGAATITYTANATNNTGITYALDAPSLSAGNTINTSTGTLTFLAGWTGSSTITATATGCNGPVSSNHIVNITPTVGNPVFTMGATSTRCQGANSVTYTATASNSTGITYSLDGGSLAAGNTINSSNGTVVYAAGWNGTSVITASAAGCNGPRTAAHTVTITPTVGLPSFTMGATSTRCHGASSVTYTATATNNTGISYSLDAASLAAGNTINSTTGEVTYVAGWTTNSVITASATGCNGPRTATHTVTNSPSVGSPVFNLGTLSTRQQGSGNIIYTATATNNTGIVYSLDAVSLAAGNTINNATGSVNYTSSWSGSSTITASAAGCNGPATSTHTATINPNIVNSPLYLSEPGQALDRVDPVSTGDPTTSSTQTLAVSGTNTVTSTIFTQAPALCSDLTIVSGNNITIVAYVNIISGTMPLNPQITATLKNGSTNILVLNNAVYNSELGLVTWTGQLPANFTMSAGQSMSAEFITSQSGVSFAILYDSQTKPSKIGLPVSTYIDFISMNAYDAPYPGGSVIYSALNNTNVYIRAIATTPFGPTDINNMTVTITPPGTSNNASLVAMETCNKTFEYVWTTPPGNGNFEITGTVYQGFESAATRMNNFNVNLCATCPPVALNDSARGAGGSPVIIDALLNDYDPNNNLNPASLAVTVQPNNGTAYLANGKIVYLPNGTYAGNDTITYQICDSTLPAPLCATAQIFVTIDPFLVDPCADATKSHIYYLPFPENEARMSLDSSTNVVFPSNNIRTLISIKAPYPGTRIVWDEWEDGYESSMLNPTQTTTKVWGDGNPYNGIAPGYNDDYLPVGASIVLDNTMPTNPRVPANIFYDGKDKIYSSGQIAVTQVTGEPSIISLQVMKTNVSSTKEFGTSFTIPVGQDFNSQDFRYTALFIRAEFDNTIINIDKDNNGSFDLTDTIGQGGLMHVNGGVMAGATVTSNKPIGVDVHFGGVDNYSSRQVPIFPATWYSHTYYSPVPTTGRAATPADTAVVMLYNSLNRPISVNWSSGVPETGTITLPAKTTVRFPLVRSQTAAYKFVNPTGESFTAIEIVDSYTPGGGGNLGADFDWAFNLIAESRLTDYATIAWAPGSIDGTRNDNPIWITPSVNTTVYVKYNGDVINGGNISPCGLRYDVSYPVNALNHRRILDPTDNDQSGMAVFTCNGAKLAALYGEDPSTAALGSPSWDVGSTIQPFCKQKLVFANDDYARTLVGQPVTISILLNDFGFLATINSASVTTTGYLQPKHGTVSVNANGTLLYTPNAGYIGNDTLEYNVCSTPSPVICDKATVYIQISNCPAPLNQNIVSGTVFLDKNKDGINNDGNVGYTPSTVYLYTDGNCNGLMDINELKDSVQVDSSGTYQFTTYPDKTVSDNFDGPNGTNTCANGTDGNAAWKSNWVDQNDPSVGYCNTGSSNAQTDAEIKFDAGFSYGLRLKDKNVSATRTVDLAGSSYAFMTFSYRRKTPMVSSRSVIVQASSDGVTFGNIFTIAGDGNADPSYVTVYNQDITAYAATTTYIRFLTNNSMADSDTVYIDNVSIQYIQYPQCYITRINSSLIPSTYHLTTQGLHPVVATNSITCLSPWDFGVARNSVTVSGTLYNDANGMTDGMVNGTPHGYPSGTTIFAYLVDASNRIAFKTTVNTGNGTYAFPLADIMTTYTLVLSSQNLAVGAIRPNGVSLPNGWVSTGDAYGTNNLAGTGIESGNANCEITVQTNLVDVLNVNFGIERVPETDNKNASYAANQPGVLYNVPGFSGIDAEDGVLGAGKTYRITSLPANAVLYYNGVPVTPNLVITGYNPALMQIDPENSCFATSFTYASRDLAGLFDPTPATVNINWMQVLSSTIIEFTASRNDALVDLLWKTHTEINTDYFQVERSTDKVNFVEVGTKVNAAGNSNAVLSYRQTDNITDLLHNTVLYYRLLLTNVSGDQSYSKVVALPLSKELQLNVVPNPFDSYITIKMNTDRATELDISLLDVTGKLIRTRTQRVSRGMNSITITNLEQIPSGMYLVKVLDKSTGVVYQKFVTNSK